MEWTKDRSTQNQHGFPGSDLEGRVARLASKAKHKKGESGIGMVGRKDPCQGKWENQMNSIALPVQEYS